jgi:hypothetical protein
VARGSGSTSDVSKGTTLFRVAVTLYRNAVEASCLTQYPVGGFQVVRAACQFSHPQKATRQSVGVVREQPNRIEPIRETTEAIPPPSAYRQKSHMSRQIRCDLNSSRNVVLADPQATESSTNGAKRPVSEHLSWSNAFLIYPVHTGCNHQISRMTVSHLAELGKIVSKFRFL